MCADSRIPVQVVQAGEALSCQASASFSTFSPRALRLRRLQLLHLLLQTLHMRLQTVDGLGQAAREKSLDKKPFRIRFGQLGLIPDPRSLTSGSSPEPCGCPAPACGWSSPGLVPPRPAARTFLCADRSSASAVPPACSGTERKRRHVRKLDL